MNNIIFLIVFLIFIFFCFTIDCPKNLPIYNDEECKLIECSEEQFKNEICVVSNDIIKTQWLNNIFTYDIEFFYENLAVTNYNNGVFFGSYNEFYGDEDEYIFSIILYLINDNGETNIKMFNQSDIETQCLYDSVILSIKINSETDNYLLYCCSNLCDLINFNNNEKYSYEMIDLSNFFRFNSKAYSLFKLNDNFNYFFGAICGGSTGYFLGISRFNFSYNELNYSIVFNNENKVFNDQRLITSTNFILPCFETEKNIIECMLVDYWKNLYIFLFEENSMDLKKVFLDKISKYNNIYKSILLEKEIGIYIYASNDKDLAPSLKIKNLIFDEDTNEYQLIDMLNYSIKINLNYNNDNLYPKFIEMIKISNERFSIYFSFNDFILILLCDLYGTNNKYDNLIIRYYKIYNELYGFSTGKNIKGFIYKNNLGFSMINNYFPFIFFIGYNENIEPDKIVNINNLNNNDTLNYIIKISDFININIKIYNNIFGYESLGIKIITLTGISSGIKYYLNNNEKDEIKENDILNRDDEIIIDYSNAEAKINDDFYLELSPILGEPEYDKFNYYTDYIQKYGEEDDKNFFQPKIFQGNTVKMKYNFGCYKNCDICEYVGLNLDEQKCITCKDSEEFCYMNNENNCFDVKDLVFNYYSGTDSLICIPINEGCPNDYPFENKNTKECKESIDLEDLISLDYKITNKKEVIDTVIELLNEGIKNKTLNTSDDTIITGINITFHITSPGKQKEYIENNLYNNISSIYLNECENKLKGYYHIDEPLIIMKIDIKRNDTISTQVEYEILNPKNGDKLNLSLCENIKINIYAPVDIDSDTFDLISQMKEQGYDIFNPNDSFYNDICTPYSSINGTDVNINDRKKDFYNSNITLCEETCEYKSFDVNTLKVNCECDAKSKINTDTDDVGFSANILLKNFYSFNKYTNYKVLKCYNLVFNLKRLKKNIGSYFIIFILICFIVVLSFNFSTQKNNYEKMFKKVIHSNSIIKQKATKRIKKTKEKFKGKGKENKEDNDKRVILTEPNDKNSQNRMRLSFVDINNIIILMSENDENQEIKKNQISSIRKLLKNKKIDNETNSYSNTFNYTLSSEDQNYSINIMNPIKSPKKMNNKKINNLETGSEVIIDNKSSENKKSDNINDINEKKNNIITDIIKGSTKSKDNNNSNYSFKHILLFDSESNSNNKKDIESRNKTISSISFPNKISTDKLSDRSENKMLDNSFNKNIDNNKINFKRKAIKTISKSKTINLGKEDKIMEEEEERITHILKNIPQKERANYFVDNELNELEYKYAVDIDFRTFFQYYWSSLKLAHPIIFTFITRNDYNLFLLKIGLFSLSFALNLTMNALFFSDDSMHKLYVDYGKFDFVYNLPQTLYSALISAFLSALLEKLALSEDSLLKIKENLFDKEIYDKKNKEIKYLVIKSIIFFIFGIIMLLFFWYYLSCFCAVYYNTQVPLIKDTLISFALGALYPFPLTLIPTLIRIPSLRKKSYCLFKISRILTFVISLL